VDIFIFTDEWVFRVHFAIARDAIGKMISDKLDNWLENLKIVARSKDTETAAAVNDASVRGLWIEIPGVPEADSAVFNGQPSGEGEAYFERTMNDDRLLAVSIERIYAKDRDSGATLTPGDTGKLTVRLAALREGITLKEDDINVTESIGELAELYTYPTSGSYYVSEDMKVNADLFIFTDEWVFRVHFAGTLGVSDRKLQDLYKNLKIVDRS
jgi:hypothetical protein